MITWHIAKGKKKGEAMFKLKQFLAVALVFTLVATGMAVVAADDAAIAVSTEKAEMLQEKAANELALGNDAEAIVLDEGANSNFGKTELGFHRISGAVITASYTWAGKIRVHK